MILPILINLLIFTSIAKEDYSICPPYDCSTPDEYIINIMQGYKTELYNAKGIMLGNRSFVYPLEGYDGYYNYPITEGANIIGSHENFLENGPNLPGDAYFNCSDEQGKSHPAIFLGWNDKSPEKLDTYIAGNSPGDCKFKLSLNFDNSNHQVVTSGRYCTITIVLTVPLGPPDDLIVEFGLRSNEKYTKASVTYRLTVWNKEPSSPFYTWFSGPLYHLSENNIPYWGETYYMYAVNINLNEIHEDKEILSSMDVIEMNISSSGSNHPCSLMIHGIFGTKICRVDECGVCDGDGSTCSKSYLYSILIPAILFVVALICTAILSLILKSKKFTRVRTNKEEEDKLKEDIEKGIDNQSHATTAAKFDWLIKRKDIVFGPEVGKGSSGTVYSGEWRGQKVAIKELSRDLFYERNRTLSEVKLAMGLRPHKNVIQILGVCLTKDNIYIIMSKMDTSLDKIVYDPVKHSKLTLYDIYRLASGICAGMIHLSGEGICHRDLAARNICLSGESIPAITDFGLSRKLVSTQSGVTETQMGPVAWMAPENFHQRYSTKSDVWSFGIVLYEIVAGKPPHEGHHDLFDLALKIRDHYLRPEIPENCDPVLAQIMEMCWRPNPADRPTFEEISVLLKNRMNELEEDLSTFVTESEDNYVEGFPRSES